LRWSISAASTGDSDSGCTFTFAPMKNVRPELSTPLCIASTRSRA
jgi:hypothetical protein